MENLAYWNLRAVEARNEYYDSGMKRDREQMVFTRRMVKKMESGLFLERLDDEKETVKQGCILQRQDKDCYRRGVDRSRADAAGLRDGQRMRSIVRRCRRRLAKCLGWLQIRSK